MGSMKASVALLAALSVHSDSTSLSETYPTRYGPVRGVELDGIVAFHSIPFAAAPVGNLRWADPVAPEPWTEVLDVANFAPACPQAYGGVVVGSEDCLKLYVYTAAKPSPPDDQLKPVLLWVHGGGLESGNGYLGGGGGPGGVYDGRNLVSTMDVVVVSIQYRLGTLGFLGAAEFEGKDGATGNYGLKDQRFAFEWVRDNIRSFGGDPSRVAIFGESAGGISMCYHLTSPASAGLFSALVMESGSCQIEVQTASAARLFARSIANRTGCAESGDDMKACMLAAKVNRLVYPLGDEIKPLANPAQPSGPSFPWGMTIDGTKAGLEAVPQSLLDRGTFNRVPVIFGTNTDEFQCACGDLPIDKCLFANGIPGATGISPPYSEDDTVSIIEHYNGRTFTADERREFLALYPASNYTTATARLSAMMVDSPGWIGSCSTQRSALSLLNAKHDDVWVYHFARLGARPRVPHFSEVAYVFQNCNACGAATASACCQGTDHSKPDLDLSALMGRFWSALARAGDPNNRTVSGVSMDLSWPRFTATDKEIMRFDTTSTLSRGYRSEKCTFWTGKS